jgi:hypothetical protein
MRDDSLNCNITPSGLAKAMDCISVLCCLNMSGTDKQKLVVTGKRAKPQCFEGINMDTLLILYYININAWMTSEIS